SGPTTSAIKYEDSGGVFAKVIRRAPRPSLSSRAMTPFEIAADSVGTPDPARAVEAAQPGRESASVADANAGRASRQVVRERQRDGLALPVHRRAPLAPSARVPGRLRGHRCHFQLDAVNDDLAAGGGQVQGDDQLAVEANLGQVEVQIGGVFARPNVGGE